MVYKRVIHGHGRHFIVDLECPPAEMRITPNLADNEFKIELLIARNCPVRKSCVRIEQEVNSICDYVAPLTLSSGRKLNLRQIACQQGEQTRPLDVDELWVDGCPLGKNCAGCEDLSSLNIPLSPIPDKSHAYITCHQKRAHEK
jgi:hypothetical protein